MTDPYSQSPFDPRQPDDPATGHGEPSRGPAGSPGDGQPPAYPGGGPYGPYPGDGGREAAADGSVPARGGQAQAHTVDSAGFLKALFDFSFSTFVTTKIVRLVYVLATVVLGLSYLVVVIGGFTRSVVFGLLALVLGGVAFIIYLAFVRMSLEFYYAIVRMSEDINRRLPGA